MRPANSAISNRPSGKNFIAVGKLKLVARTSFWNWLVLVTLTVTPVESVELPTASRARAVNVCEPFVALRVSHASA